MLTSERLIARQMLNQTALGARNDRWCAAAQADPEWLPH